MLEDEIEVLVSTCRDVVHLPFYAKTGDAGMDISAAVDVFLAPGETKLVPTGIKVAIPQGYELQVRPRSGLSYNTPLRIPNSPGTIDSGFRDEICVILNNSSCPCSCGTETETGTEINTEIVNQIETDSDSKLVKPKIRTLLVSTKGNLQGNYQIHKGDRIAQIVLNKVPAIKWQITDSVSQIGFDRGGGFGSTGAKL